jgi:hypothetical protein
MQYQDKWTRFHNKPTNGIDYSSNNGWIYSAYAKHLVPDMLDRDLLKECYGSCIKSANPVMIDRSPGQLTPPFSKDEVLGCVSLGFLKNKQLEKSSYNFCNLPTEFNRRLTFSSFIKAAKILFKIRKEHRNYIWQNRLAEAYSLAFKLPPEDIYYVKKMENKNPGIALTVLFYVNSIFTIFAGGESAKMMLWLKVMDLGIQSSILGNLVMKRHKKWIREYFGNDHIFTKVIE